MLDKELLDQVDALARDMDASRSGAVRYVLGRAVGQPSTRLTLVEEVNKVQARLRRNSGVIFERMVDVLATALEEEPE